MSASSSSSSSKHSSSTRHSHYKDLVPLDVPSNDLSWKKPSEEECVSITEKTKLAIETKLRQSGVLTSTKPTLLPTSSSSSLTTYSTQQPTFIKYTPHDGSSSSSSSSLASKSNGKLIQLTELPKDPFEPPSFGFQRLPPGPPSPPAPVMHSPPRLLSQQEKDAWKIPPCISNWKNAKGYTIPLDKRLAADGRGLQVPVINDQFAKFSEALMIAERHAREEVRQRSLMQQKLAEKEKSLKEEQLRSLAQKAREERATGFTSTTSTTYPSSSSSSSSSSSIATMFQGMHEERFSSLINQDHPESTGSDEETAPISSSSYSNGKHNHRLSEKEQQSIAEREALRKDTLRQLQREYRLSHMGQETKSKHLKKLADRDISEQIALSGTNTTGLLNKTKEGSLTSKEPLVDSRLYNQMEGLSSGFGDEEAYTVYDQPLLKGGKHPLSSLYRPKSNLNGPEEDMYGAISSSFSSFSSSSSSSVSDKFDRLTSTTSGAHFKGASFTSMHRDGPVEFEKEMPKSSVSISNSTSSSSDPFGLDAFMSQARKGKPSNDTFKRSRSPSHSSHHKSESDFKRIRRNER